MGNMWMTPTILRRMYEKSIKYHQFVTEYASLSYFNTSQINTVAVTLTLKLLGTSGSDAVINVAYISF